jgi:hypothetical protein
MTKPRSIKVNTSDQNGSRWSSGNWLNADLARITDLNGKMRLNHFSQRVPAHVAFAAWLETVVKPETFECVMASGGAFGTAYAAYDNLARFQANMKTNNNRTRHSEAKKPAESNNQ